MKKTIFALLLGLALPLFPQMKYLGDDALKWQDNKPPEIPADLAKYATDVVVLNDIAEFHFYATNNEKIRHNIVYKINTERGLRQLQTLRLPESFDPAYDADLYKQGRMARIRIPFMSEHKLVRLMARRFSGGKWSVARVKDRYEQVRWIRSSGEFIDEDITVVELQDLAVGDVVELFYELSFEMSYGTNIFYFNSAWPKLRCEYNFTYKIDQRAVNFRFFKPLCIPDSLVKRTRQDHDGYSIITDRICMRDLPAINYPANSFPGGRLPHVFVDFSFYRVYTGTYHDGGSRVYEYQLARPVDFEWVFNTDTANYYTKIYDKQFAAIRKFVSTLPPFGSDSSNKVFFKALCDTFNGFRYLTMNHLFYNQSELYGLSSGDHLQKRRLIGNSAKLCTDILNDNKVFYYDVNIQDRRFGEHTMAHRAQYAYERHLIAIPSGTTYIYFLPRPSGIKYHLNELPFYYEGALAAMFPRNFQSYVKDKESKLFKFIRTHKGTFNDNTRTENATVRISLDSLKADLVIKESLSGQFSTLLRHFYLGEHIDSTVSGHYFKKCTDKPRAIGAKVRLSSRITDYPFRYSFNCSEKIALPGSKSLDLTGWFSFPLSAKQLPEPPSHDYFFDFDFSDSYNFLLDFSSPVELKNAEAFARKVDNDLFGLESEVVKNSDSAYLLKVKLLVKQASVPVDKAPLLMELVRQLDELSSFNLQIAKK